MEAIGFYLFYAFNWVITLLPLRVLYFLSNIFYILLYHFMRYRRDVVRRNLTNSFPEKTENEIIRIEKRFYRHLADLIVEILKLQHMNNNQILKRCVVENTEMLDRLLSEGRDIVAILGHYNNWEWLVSIPLYTAYNCISVYKPLKNRYFDKYINSLRRKFGLDVTPMSMILKELINKKNSGIHTISCYLSDQTPARGEIVFWTTFLNQDTPVYLGAAKIASRYNMAVVICNHQKTRRGFYRMRPELLIENTQGMTAEEITEIHVRYLEKMIQEKPEYWIWSHRRWKHKREPSDG